MEKILFCTANFKTGRGGISSYAFDFIETFKNLYEIVVIASGDTEKRILKYTPAIIWISHKKML